MKKNIDDIFKKASEHIDIPEPQPQLWNNIRSELKDEGYIRPVFPLSFLKQRLAIAIAASVVFLIGGLAWYSMNNDTNQAEAALQNNSNSNHFAPRSNDKVESNTKEKSKAEILTKSSKLNVDSEHTLGHRNKTTNDEQLIQKKQGNGSNSNIVSKHIAKSKKYSNKASNTNLFTSKKELKTLSQSNVNKKNSAGLINTSHKKIIQDKNSKTLNSNQNHSKNHKKSISKFLKKDAILSATSTSIKTESISERFLLSEKQDKLEQNKSSDLKNLEQFITRNSIPFLTLDSRGIEQNIELPEIANIENQDSAQKHFKSIQSKTAKTRGYLRPYVSLDNTFYTNLLDSARSIEIKSNRKANYTIGIYGGYSIWKDLFIETGVLYSNRDNLNWSYNNIDNSSNSAIFDWKSNYLLIPIKLRYNIINHSFTFYTSAGTNLKLNLSTKNSFYQFLDYENGKEYKVLPQTNSLSLDVLLNAGIDWRILPELSFFIEPEFRYSVNSLLRINNFDVLPSNPKQHSFGIGVGLNYKFLK